MISPVETWAKMPSSPPAGDAITFHLRNNPYSKAQARPLPELTRHQRTGVYQPTGVSSVSENDLLSAIHRIYDPHVENTPSTAPPSHFAYFGTNLPGADRPGGASTDPRAPTWDGSPAAEGSYPASQSVVPVAAGD